MWNLTLDDDKRQLSNSRIFIRRAPGSQQPAEAQKNLPLYLDQIIESTRGPRSVLRSSTLVAAVVRY